MMQVKFGYIMDGHKSKRFMPVLFVGGIVCDVVSNGLIDNAVL